MNSEQATHDVQNLMDSEFCLSTVKVANAFRISKSSFEDQSRLVFARLISQKVRISCLDSSSMFKNTSNFMNKDVNASTMSIRKTKFPDLQ